MISFLSYDNKKKVPISKAKEMLGIIVPFYNGLNGKDNSTKEICEPFIKMIRNTKDYHVLLCYIDEVLAGFINYMYQERGLMLSEIQIKPEYQGKYNIFKSMIKHVIDNSDKSRYENIFVTINPKNLKSIAIFTHIGFKNIEGKLYSISYDDLKKYLG